MTRDQSLSYLLKHHTTPLHKKAESSHFVKALLKGNLPLSQYAQYMRELCAIYAALEAKLTELQACSNLATFSAKSLRRHQYIVSDLKFFDTHLSPLSDACSDYVNALNSISADNHILLLGHAYVRYLGDLNGGAIIARILKKRYELPDHMLSFYDFSTLKKQYKNPIENLKSSLDNIALNDTQKKLIIAEAIRAFQHNINLFEAAYDFDVRKCG